MKIWMKRGALALMAAFVVLAPALGSATEIKVYKSPYCGCCADWVDHMRENGFNVEVIKKDDVTPIKQMSGVPKELHSCHTAFVDGYVVEGHVPAEDVRRLLAEQPTAVGLSTPGMPIGSPGMEQGDQKDPYNVILFGSDGMAVWSRHNQ